MLLLAVYCVVDIRIFGRKDIMLLLKALSAVALLLSLYFKSLTVYFYLGSMISNYIIFLMAPLVASEFYPTGLRASGINGVMIAGMVAGFPLQMGWMDAGIKWLAASEAPLAQVLLAIQVVCMGI